MFDYGWVRLVIHRVSLLHVLLCMRQYSNSTLIDALLREPLAAAAVQL